MRVMMNEIEIIIRIRKYPMVCQIENTSKKLLSKKKNVDLPLGYRNLGSDTVIVMSLIGG